MVAELAQPVGRPAQLGQLLGDRGHGAVLGGGSPPAHGSGSWSGLLVDDPTQHPRAGHRRQDLGPQPHLHRLRPGEEQVAALVGLVDEDETGDAIGDPRGGGAHDRPAPAVTDEHERPHPEVVEEVDEVAAQPGQVAGARGRARCGPARCGRRRRSSSARPRRGITAPHEWRENPMPASSTTTGVPFAVTLVVAAPGRHRVVACGDGAACTGPGGWFPALGSATVGRRRLAGEAGVEPGGDLRPGLGRLGGRGWRRAGRSARRPGPARTGARTGPPCGRAGRAGPGRPATSRRGANDLAGVVLLEPGRADGVGGRGVVVT